MEYTVLNAQTSLKDGMGEVDRPQELYRVKVNVAKDRSMKVYGPANDRMIQATRITGLNGSDPKKLRQVFTLNIPRGARIYRRNHRNEHEQKKKSHLPHGHFITPILPVFTIGGLPALCAVIVNR